MDLFKKTSKFLYEILESTTFALAVISVAYLFIFQPMEVMGSSSSPTLLSGERVFVEKITSKLGEIQRGDFVVPESPNNPDISFIKRVIGLPYEQIMIKNGKVYINNKPLNEDYLSPNVITFTGPYAPEGKIVTLSKDEYFLMGDNRSGSFDSRNFGPVRKDKILGRAIFRFWPPDKFGGLK